MNKTERHEQRILNELHQTGTLTVAQAMKLLNVSESTVRRLFTRLESNGVAIRRYGGIQLLREHRDDDYHYDQVVRQAVLQKKKLAQKTVKQITSGDILYIDSGTTMACLCAQLAQRITLGELTNLTVFTNSLVNLEILSPHLSVSLIGGEYRSNRRDFSGYLSEKILNGLHFTKCFLGADGYHPHHGFTATDFSTAHLNELVLANTDKAYVVIDSSKFMMASMVSYSHESTIHVMVTDKVPPQAMVKQLEESQIELILC